LLHTFHACHGFEAPLRQIAPQVIRPLPGQHSTFRNLVPRPAGDARDSLLPRQLLLAYLLAIVLVIDLGHAQVHLDAVPVMHIQYDTHACEDDTVRPECGHSRRE
jgi:hypothetical protein